MVKRRRPGVVRDAIIGHFQSTRREASVDELYEAVNAALGESVPQSSIRSYLNENTPGMFERVGRGRYRLVRP